MGQILDVPTTNSLNKTLHQLCHLGRNRRKAWTPFEQKLLGPVIVAAAVSLALPNDTGDLRVIVIKDFTQQEHGSFGRREVFQQHEKSHRNALVFANYVARQIAR